MSTLRPLEQLAASWREEAELLRRRGLEREAGLEESFAAELEERLREWKLELLSLHQAAEETGLAYDTVQRKVSSGEWLNHGEKGSPLVRRCEVHPGLEKPAPNLSEEEGDVVDRRLRAEEAAG